MTQTSTAPRIAILGNAAGGKSTLARTIARDADLPLTEMDRIMWTRDWTLRPSEQITAEHDALIAKDRWVIEGLGLKPMLRPRLARATRVIHIDLPMWQHYWLMAERQKAWMQGTLDHPPGGNSAMADLRGTYELVDFIDRNWTPDIRTWVDDARAWADVTVIRDVAELPGFTGPTAPTFPT